ncbi:MAG: hypothetical protein LKK13_00905 [Bacilli bacterium]|jgi:uncharacterized protein YaaQ|nr:hypothetical protein [Bacilli bacterium]MCI2110888.1 hypothetical protein [Bacilli bacterium]
MKVLLFAVLESGHDTEKLLSALSHDGYNGTVIATTSLKHVLMSPHEEEPAFISLSNLADNTFEGNTTLYILVDEEKLPKLQEDIRTYSGNFTKIKGGMFTLPVETFEGSI